MTKLITTPKKAAKKRKDFKVELSKLPNGTMKPVETCDLLDAMRNWRAESAHSSMVIG